VCSNDSRGCPGCRGVRVRLVSSSCKPGTVNRLMREAMRSHQVKFCGHHMLRCRNEVAKPGTSRGTCSMNGRAAAPSHVTKIFSKSDHPCQFRLIIYHYCIFSFLQRRGKSVSQHRLAKRGQPERPSQWRPVASRWVGSAGPERKWALTRRADRSTHPVRPAPLPDLDPKEPQAQEKGVSFRGTHICCCASWESMVSK
jgi:hypothetical protein